MSTSNNHYYGRSGVQIPAPNGTSRAYRDYGAVEAAQSQSQAADNLNRAPYGDLATKIILNIVRALIIIPCVLIVAAIVAGILGTTSGAFIVTGHWILLHLNPTLSPYSEVSLWSSFVLGFWGSAAIAIPFWLLYCWLDPDFKFVCAAESLPAFLNLALVIAKIGLECIVGVPLVRALWRDNTPTWRCHQCCVRGGIRPNSGDGGHDGIAPPCSMALRRF
ncbi:hypothetical protein F5146DRAFT_528835 [Armillaria mellea]|nr:hypothetical protein F5146DRAFT_528835 [Armillaria mellea]